MIEADFLLNIGHGNTLLIEKCNIHNLLMENDIITIKRENFEYEFEIMSLSNMIDNGVHRIVFTIGALYERELVEIVRKIRILDLD